MPTPAGYIDRTLIGTQEQLPELLKQADRRGTVVAVTRPRPVAGDDRLFYVRARLAERRPSVRTAAAPARSEVRPRPRTGRIVAIAAAVILALGLVALAGVLLVAAIITVLPMILGALFVIGLIWFALGRAGVCAGIHCPGCRH